MNDRHRLAFLEDQAAAGAKETAAASAELARLGGGLQGLINRFRV